MQKWLAPALDYIPRWMDFQMRMSQQPGCVIAIAHKSRIVLEQAFGHADLAKGTPLTPRHRFRVASHSKSYTAAGVMKLREQGKLKLDDAVGHYVKGLNPRVARTTLGQILSHSAGIVRDGKEAGQFLDRRPFLNAEELMADLQAAPAIEPNTRFKYSNHGFGLIGLVIEAVTGEPFTTWMKREIIDAAGLEETHPDMPIPQGRADGERPQRQAAARPARGHSRRLHDQRHRAGRRGRQHRPRPGAVLRSALAEGQQKRALGREPTRDGPPPVAQPAFEPRALLRPRHHQRQLGRLGVVRPFRRACKATSRAPA